ncbi:MAG: hypothetical protein E7310_06430 [Clostridiales bacterium]|nr:hypothetical protein [Clostridiales bacterium]
MSYIESQINKVKGMENFDFSIQICNQNLNIYTNYLNVTNDKLQKIFKILQEPDKTKEQIDLEYAISVLKDLCTYYDKSNKTKEKEISIDCMLDLIEMYNKKFLDKKEN